MDTNTLLPGKMVDGDNKKKTLSKSRGNVKSDDKQRTSFDAVVYATHTSNSSKDDDLLLSGSPTKNTQTNGNKISSTYQLENYEKRVLHVFNQVNCYGQEPRHGTEKDFENLKSTFESYGFEVLEYKDKDVSEIENILHEITDPNTMNFSDYGCIGVVVLSHGYYNGILSAKDDTYHEQIIIDHFLTSRNTTFINKPRFIIIQACRGNNDISGIGVHCTNIVPCKKTSEQDCYYTLELEPDMFLLHSSYLGNPSHRTLDGTWLIKNLCNELSNGRASTTDWVSIITSVKRNVAIDETADKYIAAKEQYLYNKQMPISMTTFTKALYLNKYSPKVSHPDNDVTPEHNASCTDMVSASVSNCFSGTMNYLRACCGYTK